jgi:ABC-type dipeptide/oligopeptide/nickel transport system permease component
LGTITIVRARYSRHIPVSEIVADAYPKSMGLLLVSLALSATIGIPLGMAAAIQRRSGWSLGLLAITLVGISLPTFLVAAIIQTLEVLWYRRTGTRLFPVGGFGWDLHLVGPALVIAARPLATLARVSYMALSEALGRGYIDTAKAKGLASRAIRSQHAYPNATIPILAAVGVSLRYALGSLPVVETLVGWPGLGVRLLDAIREGQTQGVIGLALALALTIMFVNLVLEVSYRLVDPRLSDQPI